MSTETGKKHAPPYVSYRTFLHFIERLQQRLPSRIDRSYWGETLSGSTGAQLMAALRFLKLVDDNGKPTEKLKPLVAARGEQRAQILRDIVRDAFAFVMNGSLDLQNATYAELEEVFHAAFQITDDVNRKCVKFFIAIASDAGIPISPFITRRSRTAHPSSGTRAAQRKSIKRTNRNNLVPESMEQVPQSTSWHSLLLAKFPSFDPNWSDEIKMKWFAAFDELLKKDVGH